MKKFEGTVSNSPSPEPMNLSGMVDVVSKLHSGAQAFSRKLPLTDWLQRFTDMKIVENPYIEPSAFFLVAAFDEHRVQIATASGSAVFDLRLMPSSRHALCKLVGRAFVGTRR